MSEGSRPTRWRLLAAGALAAAAIVVCGGLVAIATGGTDAGVVAPTAGETGAFTGAFTGGFGTDTGVLTDSVGATGGAIGGGGGGSKRRTSALWTGVGIGSIVALLAGCAILLRRSRPPEATDEGPDFWADEPAPPDERVT